MVWKPLVFRTSGLDLMAREREVVGVWWVFTPTAEGSIFRNFGGLEITLKPHHSYHPCRTRNVELAIFCLSHE